mmetsp:Transcript_95129/g.254230  ORF Transcript_95129/g.254230 Transcript_95129/m.254230 type:complete len:993 (+) Transcript_95129:7-2985(+)
MKAHGVTFASRPHDLPTLPTQAGPLPRILEGRDDGRGSQRQKGNLRPLSSPRAAAQTLLAQSPRSKPQQTGSPEAVARVQQDLAKGVQMFTVPTTRKQRRPDPILSWVDAMMGTEKDASVNSKSMDPSMLLAAGLEKEDVERIHRAMLVYSNGLFGLLKDAVAMSDRPHETLHNLWVAIVGVLRSPHLLGEGGAVTHQLVDPTRQDAFIELKKRLSQAQSRLNLSSALHRDRAAEFRNRMTHEIITLESLQAEIKQCVETVHTQAESLRESQTRVERLSEQSTLGRRALRALVDELSLIQKETLSFEAGQATGQRVCDLHMQLEKLQQKLQDAEDKAAELRGRWLEVDQKNKKLQQEIQDQEQQEQELMVGKDQCVKRVASLTKEQQVTSSEVWELEEVARAKLQEVERAREATDAVVVDRDRARFRVAELKGQVDSLRSSRQQDAERLREFQAQFDALQLEYDQAAAACERLQASAEITQGSASDNRKKYTQLEFRVAELESLLRAKAQELEGVLEDVAHYQKVVKEATALETESRVRSEKMAVRYEGLLVDLKAAKQRQVEVDFKLSNAQSAVDKMKQSHSAEKKAKANKSAMMEQALGDLRLIRSKTADELTQLHDKAGQAAKALTDAKNDFVFLEKKIKVVEEEKIRAERLLEFRIQQGKELEEEMAGSRMVADSGEVDLAAAQTALARALAARESRESVMREEIKDLRSQTETSKKQSDVVRGDLVELARDAADGAQALARTKRLVHDLDEARVRLEAELKQLAANRTAVDEEWGRECEREAMAAAEQRQVLAMLAATPEHLDLIARSEKVRQALRSAVESAESLGSHRDWLVSQQRGVRHIGVAPDPDVAACGVMVRPEDFPPPTPPAASPEPAAAATPVRRQSATIHPEIVATLAMQTMDFSFESAGTHRQGRRRGVFVPRPPPIKVGVAQNPQSASAIRGALSVHHQEVTGVGSTPSLEDNSMLSPPEWSSPNLSLEGGRSAEA